MSHFLSIPRSALLFTLAFSCLIWAENLSYVPDPNWKAPAAAAARTNPLAARPSAAAGGRKLFGRECVECHGPEGGGSDKKHSADLRLPLVQAQTDGTLFWKITNGNPDRGMPPFSKLPELQRSQLVLYIRTLKNTDTQNK